MMPVEDMKKCEDFYMEYAFSRMEMYFKQRPMFLGKESPLSA